MAYSALAVANRFIELAAQDGHRLTPLKLVKLVYIAHGWFLALSKGHPLLTETIEAWQYGPVVPSVYREFSHFGSRPIDQKAMLPFSDLPATLPAGHDLAHQVIEKVWETYRRRTAIELSAMTHQENTPWARARADMGEEFVRHYPIKDDYIFDHYSSRLRSQLDVLQ